MNIVLAAGGAFSLSLSVSLMLNLVIIGDPRLLAARRHRHAWMCAGDSLTAMLLMLGHAPWTAAAWLAAAGLGAGLSRAGFSMARVLDEVWSFESREGAA